MPEESWKQLYRYWLSKHVDGRPPSRNDIDPLIDIPRLVANLMLMDLIPEGYRYRVIGSEIVERHKVSLTGKLFGSSAIDIKALYELRSAIDKAAVEQKPQLLAARIGNTVSAKNTLLILPLVSGEGETEKILMGSFYNEYYVPESRREGMIPIEIVL